MPRRPSPNSTSDTPAEPARRKRRSPEQAKAEILDAAERLFAQKGPDRVAVADVAIEAGVSGALVLHYFGTYADLVRSVLARRNKWVIQQIKQRMLSRSPTSTEAPSEDVLGVFLDVVCEPIHARLLAWAALSGEGVHLQMVKKHGLAKFVDFVLTLIPEQRAKQTDPVALRQRLEEVLLVAISASHGYAMGKSIYVPALGLHADTEHQTESAQRTVVDERFRRALSSMLRSYIAELL